VIPHTLVFAPYVLLTSAVLPFIVLRQARRRDSSEAFLVIPILLIGLFFLTQEIANLLIAVPALSGFGRTLDAISRGTQLGPFQISYEDLTDIVSMFSLALVILIRTNRMSRQKTLIETEIANAGEVQRVMLPETADGACGFTVESDYSPAQKVGGDFFQAIPVGNDRLLLVLGDVTGKGLPAAMLVSVLVGSTRTVAEFTCSPEEVLIHLNRRMMGRTHGGFCTAIAALFREDGSVSIANAGHLPPYLDGCEVEVPGALPLGISSDVTYSIVQFQLEPSSRLMFYTDGLVEAQDRCGQLFGFDRAKAISMKPPAEIAEQAKRFGQNDDITVVVVRRNPLIQEKNANMPDDALVTNDPCRRSSKLNSIPDAPLEVEQPD
jgi:hypothetical protein